MYTPVVLTRHAGKHRIVRRGNQSFTDLEDAKEAAKKLPIATGQRPAVVDDQNQVHWEGEMEPLKDRMPNGTNH